MVILIVSQQAKPGRHSTEARKVQRLSISTVDKGLNATRDFNPSQLPIYPTKNHHPKDRMTLMRSTIHWLIFVFGRHVMVVMQGGKFGTLATAS